MSQLPKSAPAPAKELHLLRDGYWDRTAIIELASDKNQKRVRKISKGDASAGPWGKDNLRAEAQYLASLEDELTDFFPPLLDRWDNATTGYDMGYMEGYVDVGHIARQQLFSQSQADAMQAYLGERLFQQLHQPNTSAAVLVANMQDTLDKAHACLLAHPQLDVLLPNIHVNDLAADPLEQQLKAIYKGPLLAKFAASPQVRLHGDLFLENMLLPASDPGSPAQQWPQSLILIDPISVAGIGAGHPLFDLGKYESYACGELPAMRQQRLIIEGFDDVADMEDGVKTGHYRWAIDWQDPAMTGFSNINWHQQLRSLYVQHYGPVDTAMYELLQAYFAAAMVVCTQGREQQARALKMRASLQLALNG